MTADHEYMLLPLGAVDVSATAMDTSALKVKPLLPPSDPRDRIHRSLPDCSTRELGPFAAHFDNRIDLGRIHLLFAHVDGDGLTSRTRGFAQHVV